MLNKKIKAYFSHPIRGREGDRATPENIAINRGWALSWAKILWLHIGSNLELYVPAKHENFIQIALNKGYLNIHQVLDVDCEIVTQQDVLLVANWEDSISSGMQKEIDQADKLEMPIFLLKDLGPQSILNLEFFLEKV